MVPQPFEPAAQAAVEPVVPMEPAVPQAQEPMARGAAAAKTPEIAQV